MTKQEWRKNFGLNLKEKILESGKTKTDICRAMGIRLSVLSRYLNGEVEPTSSSLLKLAKAIGCMADELIKF